MENHPIPQDITGFQFKLIGEMTVKQFGYLIAGIILGWLFVFVLPIFFLIRVPLGILFVALGFALAFVPIDGRPFDSLFSAFISSLLKPNQYVFVKDSQSFLSPIFAYSPSTLKHDSRKAAESKISEDQLTTFLQTASPRGSTKWDAKEQSYLDKITQNTFSHNPLSPQEEDKFNPNKTEPKKLETPIQISQAPAQEVIEPQQVQENAQTISKTISPPKQSSDLDLKLQQNINTTLVSSLDEPSQTAVGNTTTVDIGKERGLEKEALQAQELAKSAKEKVAELEHTLSDSVSQKQQLENELAQLKQQVATGSQKVFAPSVQNEQLETTQHVKILNSSSLKSTKVIPTPEEPNLLTGIVNDPRGNPLPNILIEVKDKDQNPVRAFKTNMLGRFASATQLQNGIYTIEFDDPKGANKFDTIQLEAKGEIMPPLLISSVDAREELRRSLFNVPTQPN